MMPSLHTAALCWLRYGKKMPVVCTEAGAWNADVIGMTSALCIEVEVKKSIADLRADFRNKPQKHFVYNTADDLDPKTWAGYIPNYFYYFTTEDLAEKAEAIIREKAPKAGLAVLTARDVEIRKRPTKLHKRPPSPSFLRSAVSRMSSEICRSKMLLEVAKKTQPLLTPAVLNEVLDALTRVDGVLDFEDQIGDLERRGAELAWVVERKTWQDLNHVERFRWIFAAQQLLTLRRPQRKDINDAEIG